MQRPIAITKVKEDTDLTVPENKIKTEQFVIMN